MPELVPLLSPAECAAIVAAARGCARWQDATLTLGETVAVNAAIRTARLLSEDDLPAALRAVWDDVRARVARLDAVRGRDLTIGEIQVVRYPAGGFFLTHQDAIDGPREWRKLSFIVYLNDDFSGGDTCFPGANTVSVRPRTGYALTFAPYVPHYADTVTAGEKFILLFWLGRDQS